LDSGPLAFGEEKRRRGGKRGEGPNPRKGPFLTFKGRKGTKS